MPATHSGPRILDELSTFLASTPTREQLLAFRPSEGLQQRARELLDKSAEGNLSSEERRDLDEFAHAERLMRLVKARLRQPSGLQP